MRKRDARHKRVVKVCDVDEEVVHGHALCAALVAQALDRVERLQRREAGRVDEAEDEDGGDDAARAGRGAGEGRVGGGVGEREARGGVRGDVGGVEGGDGDEDENDEEGRGEELLAPAPAVGEGGAEEGARQRDEGLEAVEEKARVVVGDAGALEDGGIIVRNGTVPNPLIEVLVGAWAETVGREERFQARDRLSGGYVLG